MDTRTLKFKGLNHVLWELKRRRRGIKLMRDSKHKNSDFSSFRFQDRFLAVGDLGGRIESLDIEVKKEVWGLRGHEVKKRGEGIMDIKFESLNFNFYIFFYHIHI